MEEYRFLNQEGLKKITELHSKIEMLEMQAEEMRIAFRLVKEGKEKELRDAHFTFFSKRRELVDSYNELASRFETFKSDTQKELGVKDEIIEQWRKRHAEVIKELKLAKVILQDQTMSKIAQRQFQTVIADINEEQLLQEGCKIKDLLEEFMQRQNFYQVTQTSFNPPEFDKNKVKIVPKKDPLA